MKRAAVIALLLVAAIPLLVAVASLPPQGSAAAPAYTHVASRYLERGAEEAGAENLVTGVILNYRGFDTDGEVTVIFTACVATAGILLVSGSTGAAVRLGSVVQSPIVSYVGRLIAPFIAMFAFYVVLFGEVAPGGGFQGGTIYAALVIVTSIVIGREEAERLVPYRARPWIQAAGPLSFLAAGMLGLVVAGWYLGFPVGNAPSVAKAMLGFIEFGIGVGGATVFALIFWRLGDAA